MARLDIIGVQAFVAVAEIGSFRGAASHLHLSESALGRRLKKLEDDLGVVLVVRTTRSVAVSQEGADFYPKARLLVRDLAESLESLRTRDHAPSGTVRVGCLPTLAATLVAPVLRQFSDQFPKIRVQIFDRSATEINEAVAEGEIDFAITVAKNHHPRLKSEQLFLEPMVVICPSDLPLGDGQFVCWKELVGKPLISIGNLSANRALIEDIIRGHDFKLTWTYQVEHLSTAVSLVTNGTGIAILPRAAVIGHNTARFKSLSLREPRLMRHIVILHRKMSLNTMASLFEAHLRAQLPELEQSWNFSS